jgi:hypothetical protein
VPVDGPPPVAGTIMMPLAVLGPGPDGSVCA